MIKKIKSLILPKTKNNIALEVTAAGESPVETTSPKVILQKQILLTALVALGVLAAIFIVIKLITGNRTISDKQGAEKDKIEGKMTIEVASKSLDPEIMWRNHFEDKLIASNEKLTTKLEVIEESFVKKEEQLEDATKKELAGMSEQLKFAKEELREALNELRATREQMSQKREMENQPALATNISSRLIEDERNIDRPKSSRNFIPETAYVKGVMLNGISVSTSVSSSAEPVPVIIRITDRGNLPRDFELNLKHCRVLGSGYGDLSSERAIIRAEVMSCRDFDNDQIITTRIAGAIFGDDGMGGIKGKVIQTSNKQIRHAFVGGLLSGFSNAAKSQEQFILTGAGAVGNKTAGWQERLKDSGISGLGNAGEKIADFYLRQAEAMSPVLKIPGGTRVDVVFTKGVYVGSFDVREKIAKARGNQDRGADNE